MMNTTCQLIVCVPEEMAIQRLDFTKSQNGKGGWVRFDTDWNAFKTESDNELMFGDYQIRLGWLIRDF